MKARDRHARACYLTCGRERAPNNPYKLCYHCLRRLYEITGAARKAKASRRTEHAMEDEVVVVADELVASVYGEPAL